MPGLGAPPPPPPGGAPEAPPPNIPRLSVGAHQDKPGQPKGLHIRVAENLPKAGAKGAAKPGKPAPVLRKRPALGPIAKAGIAVAVLALAVSGIFAYRIFFPPPSREVKISIPPIAAPKPLVDVKQAAADAAAKAAAKLVESGQNAIALQRQAAQAKVDAAASGEEVTPTPPPDVDATQSVMAQANIGSDVKANITRLDSSTAASADFRAFVANADIGGVFQGVHSRALINGKIVREGQVLDDSLGIIFERIDSDKKVIYFKDASGAEVSKNY